MSRMNRRQFVYGLASGAVAAGTALAAPTVFSSRSYAADANSQIGLGFIGLGGRGNQLADGFSKQKNARIVAVADPDQQRAGQAKEKYNANAYSDLRKLLEDPAVDAVVIASCNHWHCLAAIWAIQAGKDVFVEKPLSHSQWEGQKVIEAARKHNRVVQLGTQQRSDPMQEEIKQFLHEEKALGNILYAQANRLGPRGPIGKRESPLPIPRNVDYNLWLGPAQEEPIYRNNLHYDWHWDWNTGSGEMGNWGVHVLDDVRNVAYQDTVSTPQRILAVGGRVAWDDAGNTPNVHYVYFDTGSFPTLIALSNLQKGPEERGGWATKAGRPVEGPGTGYVIACEGGYYLGQRGRGKAVDTEGKEIRAFQGGDMNSLHQQNFLEAVATGDSSLLTGGIETGHYSSGWCNLANVGFRAGKAFSREEAESVQPDFDAWGLLLDEMASHLGKFGISPTDAEIRMSPVLEHNPKTEQFVGPHAARANQFLRRVYRQPFVVPEQV
jgi:predicted dehydrogenase